MEQNDPVVMAARRFLDDARSRPQNASEAESVCQDCTSIFSEALAVRAILEDEFDNVLFAASYDLGLAVFGSEVSQLAISKVLDAIRSLFENFYSTSPGGLSCHQFWDNVLGYRDEPSPSQRSATSFLAGALQLLGDLSRRPETHIRASALHGLNHFPDGRSARNALQIAEARESEPQLRDYARDSLDAMAAGRRLV
jgi:hypothetical protein